MLRVAALWRHPIKSHGRKAPGQVVLAESRTMPQDRSWAVAHGATQFDASVPAWMVCRNFMFGSVTPDFAGIWAQLNREAAQIAQRHDAPGALRDGWNHQNFGVYAKVIKSGKVALNDKAKVV